MPASCRFRRRFRRCGLPRVGSCQYCGLSFCAVHGTIDDNGQQICMRDICTIKQADLSRHLVFRDRALLRNRHGMCGIEGCLEGQWGQCSKCRAVYCEGHLLSRMETVRHGLGSNSRPASFCQHCQQRRKLWSRV